MHIFYLIASIILVIASLYDGFSTRYALKQGNYEQNPLFGSYPSTLRLFGEGMAIIAGEIVFGWAFGHYKPEAYIVVGIGWLVQSAFHFYFGTNNWNTEKA